MSDCSIPNQHSKSSSNDHDVSEAIAKSADLPHDTTVEHEENKENTDVPSSRVVHEQPVKPVRKKATPPAPSILDFMSDADVKRLTKANTRKNLGQRRKTFRSPFSRRRTDNFSIPHDDDDPPTIEAIPVVDSDSLKRLSLSSTSTNASHTVPQSKPIPILDISSPITPAPGDSQSPFVTPKSTLSTSRSTISSSSVLSGHQQLKDNTEDIDDDLALDPAPESSTQFDTTCNDKTPSSSKLPPTMSLAPSYQRKLLAEGDNSIAWTATSDIAPSVVTSNIASPQAKVPRSVRICSRVKVVDYLKQRPYSPASSQSKPRPSGPSESLMRTTADCCNAGTLKNTGEFQKHTGHAPESDAVSHTPKPPDPLTTASDKVTRRVLLKSASANASPNTENGKSQGKMTAVGLFGARGGLGRMCLLIPGRKKSSACLSLSKQTTSGSSANVTKTPEDVSVAITRSSSASAALPSPRSGGGKIETLKESPVTNSTVISSSHSAYGRRADEIRKFRADLESR